MSGVRYLPSSPEATTTPSKTHQTPEGQVTDPGDKDARTPRSATAGAGVNTLVVTAVLLPPVQER